MDNRSIGGEFEISPDLLIKPKSHINYFKADYLFSTGRTALFYILRNEHIEDIYIPDYVCSCVNDVVIAAHKKIRKYHINEKLEPEIPETNEKILFLLVNHFGLLDIEKVIVQVRKKNPNSIIILDNVQSLFEMSKNYNVDYAFSSFRKWLPVPDGAPVKTKKKLMELELPENIFAINKIKGSLLKNYKNYPEVKDSEYIKEFEIGEDLIDGNWNCRVSSFTENILNNLDYERIKEKRKNNFNYLFTSLKDIKSERLCFLSSCYDKINDENFVPMFLPIFTGEKQSLRKYLMKNEMFFPSHWPLDNSDLFNKEISLVIDQRYSEKDMERISATIKEWLKCR